MKARILTAIRRASLVALFVAAALAGIATGVVFAFTGDLPQISALDDYAPSTITRLYDRDGRHMFDQILARSWERATGEAEIREYRITKKPSDYPVERDGVYVVPWTGANVPRRVIAPHMVETWHQSDGEICERKRWPVDARRSLFPEMKP